MSARTGRLLVIDEWILHDIGENNRNDAYRFLTRLQTQPDRIVITRDDPWSRKAFQLMKASGLRGDPVLRKLSQLLHSVLNDSSCCLQLLSTRTTLLPPSQAALLPRKDLYLVETYMRASADLLVTHDGPLLTALSNHCPQVNAQTKGDFLAGFLS